MTDKNIEDVLNLLEEAYEGATRGIWQRGETSHHTKNQADYHIAEFRHSRDANFCDHAHNNFPQILQHIRKLQTAFKEFAGKVKLDEFLSMREEFESDYKLLYPEESLARQTNGQYESKETEMAYQAYHRVYKQLKAHVIKKKLHSHYVVGKKDSSGISFSTRPKVHSVLDKAIRDKEYLEDKYKQQFNVYGKIHVPANKPITQPQVDIDQNQEGNENV